MIRNKKAYQLNTSRPLFFRDKSSYDLWLMTGISSGQMGSLSTVWTDRQADRYMTENITFRNYIGGQ